MEEGIFLGKNGFASNCQIKSMHEKKNGSYDWT